MTKTQQKQQKSTQNNQIILCWCDNGSVDGKFAEGVIYSIIGNKLPITSAMRVQGNQIGRQRQQALEFWFDKTDFEWMLWVDSDIVLTNEALEKIWKSAHPIDRPIVSGTYFVSKENEKSLMSPYPALFNWVEDDGYKMSYVHPLPKDALLQVGAAGFGLLLMHRNVVKKMRAVHGTKPFFNETGVGEQFVSEDINFFKLMRDAKVPLHAHTGAVVKHMKRFAFDIEFYKLFWNNSEQRP